MPNLEFVIRRLWIVVCLTLLLGCRPQPSEVRRVPTPIPPTPFPQEAQRVDRATNVSFSTYSKDWPVGWLWIDPDERNVRTPHNVKKAVLSLTIPTGKDLARDNRTAPRYMKALSGDFEIETRVRALPKENFQGAGLLIYWNDNNYIRLERSFAGPDGGEGIAFRIRRGDQLEQLTVIDDHSEMTDLKFRRQGASFSCYWRRDERAA
jgi:hypothetical protein